MPMNTLWRPRRWLERIIGAGEELSGPSETGRDGTDGGGAVAHAAALRRAAG